MLTNIIGSVAEGTDFFGRDEESSKLRVTCARQNVVLLAPRRVGKTSLLKHMATDFAPDAIAVYIDVEAEPDEQRLIRRMIEGIRRAPEQHVVARTSWARKATQLARQIESVTVASVAVKTHSPAEARWRSDADELESLLTVMTAPDAPHWYLLVDELPVFVHRLLVADPTAQRARMFLEWCRSLRQRWTPSSGVHWLLCGSIGLDALTSRHRMSSTVNDLAVARIGPFSVDTAKAFLQALGASYAMPVDEALARSVCERVEWLIPHHLQIMFRALLDQRPHTGTPSEITQRAMDAAAQQAGYFEHWNGRLSEELGSPDDRHARMLLASCAIDPLGAGRDTLDGALAREIQDDFERRESMLRLLRGLEADGYLHEDMGRFRFRSALLRGFWVWRYL